MTNDALANNPPMGGLRIDKDAYGVRYLGSGADLVQAGIVRPEQLPGESGPRKRSAVYYNGQPASRGRTFPRDEKYMQITLVGKGRFTVWIPLSPDAAELGRLAVRQRLDEAHARGKAAAEAERKLERIPASKEKYRQECLEMTDSLLGTVVYLTRAQDLHGYSFDFNTLQEVKAASARLLAALQAGGVVFDAARHRHTVSALREQAGLPPERPRLRLVAAGPTLVSEGHESQVGVTV